jgi:hypothetical protein
MVLSFWLEILLFLCTHAQFNVSKLVILEDKHTCNTNSSMGLGLNQKGEKIHEFMKSGFSYLKMLNKHNNSWGKQGMQWLNRGKTTTSSSRSLLSSLGRARQTEETGFYYPSNIPLLNSTNNLKLLHSNCPI